MKMRERGFVSMPTSESREIDSPYWMHINIGCVESIYSVAFDSVMHLTQLTMIEYIGSPVVTVFIGDIAFLARYCRAVGSLRKLSSLIEWVELSPIQLLTVVWANQLI